MKPRALLVDDEELPRRDLRQQLAQLWPELEIAAECDDGAAALHALGAQQPEVMFLDIRMPALDGLQVARLAAGRTHVVFVTAYDAHALAAFDAGAIDYLTKPVSAERLATTVERLRTRLAARVQPLDLSALIGSVAPPPRLQWISASVGNVIKLFSIDDVVYFASDDKYTRVVTEQDEAHVRTPLKQLLDGVDPNVFWQINRGLLVRASAVRRVHRDEMGRMSVELAGRLERLPVSRAYAQRFKPM